MELLEGKWPWDTLTLGFGPPEPREGACLLFRALLCVLISDDSHRTLVWEAGRSWLRPRV